MRCIRWDSGLNDPDKKILLAATSSATSVFKRLLKLLDEDLQSSIQAMGNDDICHSHALLSKEVGKQVAIRQQITMINQIIKE